jgi:hypothetical protein
MKKESFAINLADTLATASSLDLSADIVEFAVDQTLESGVLKDIPFVGWIAKLASVRTSISDNLFLAKLLRFLTRLESLGDAEKIAFSTRIEADPVYARKVGEKLIFALDRIDDTEKSDILAHCFDHFLTGHVSYEEFSELSHVIDRSMLSDLSGLVADRQPFKYSEYGRLVSTGLASFGISPADVGEDTPSIGYKISEVGARLRRILRREYREYIEEVRAGGPLRHFFIDPFESSKKRKTEQAVDGNPR